MTKVKINESSMGFTFEVISRSGRPVVQSTSAYSRKRDAVRGARSFVKNYMRSAIDIQDMTATAP
jgi:hypothetical protein